MKNITLCYLVGISQLVLATSSMAEVPPAEKTPIHIGPPQELHATTNRGFQGIPSFAISPQGRMWATWYAGISPGEDHNNYVVLSTSADGGETWQEVMVVDPDKDGPVRTFDPELWVSPDGKLYWFWAQAIGHGGYPGGVWAITTDDPEAAQPK